MIKIENVHYKYSQSEFELKVNNLSIEPGENIALTGASGSGKSTLVKIISGEIKLPSGKVKVLGQNLNSMTERDLRNFRLNNIGLFSQDFSLLDYLNVEDNILLLKTINPKIDLLPNWKDLAEQCGILAFLKKYPSQLSEGEKQRVALCRTLSTQAKLILTDEPTSSLDHENSEKVTKLMIQNCKDLDRTLVMVTHDRSLLKYFDRVIDIDSLRRFTDV